MVISRNRLAIYKYSWPDKMDSGLGAGPVEATDGRSGLVIFDYVGPEEVDNILIAVSLIISALDLYPPRWLRLQGRDSSASLPQGPSLDLAILNNLHLVSNLSFWGEII